MRILLSLLCTIFFFQLQSQSSTEAQKLYTWDDNITQFTTLQNNLQSHITALDKEYKSSGKDKAQDRNAITKSVFMIAGQAKGMANQATNAKQITADMLTKYQRYEWELVDEMKKQKGGGYYTFSPNDVLTLTNISAQLYTLKEQLKSNGYQYTYGSPNGDKNLQLLKQFNKLYTKYVETLLSTYTAL